MSFKSVLARVGGSTADARPAAEARGIPGVTHAVPTPAAQPAAPLPSRRDATHPHPGTPATRHAQPHPAPAHGQTDAAAAEARRRQGTDRLKAMFTRARPDAHGAAPQPPSQSPGTLANAVAHVNAAATDISTPFSQHSDRHRPLSAQQYRTDVTRYAADTKASHAAALARKQRKRVGDALGAAMPAIAEDEHPDADEAALQLESLDSRAGLSVQVQSWFPDPHAGAQASRQLADRLAGLGAPDRAPAMLRGVLTASALREAGVSDPAQARDVLDALASLDFARMDTQTSALPAGAAREIDVTRARAWLVARTLSRTDEGFDALRTLRGPGHEPPLQLMAQRMMLQAADHADPGPHGALTAASDPAPGAVQARLLAGPDAAALPARAFSAAAIANTGGATQMRPDQKGDFFAWRQHFRDDGAGTPLAMTRERLHRFTGKTLDRAGENRWKTFAARAVGKHRSPLAAVRNGTQDVTRLTIAKEKKALGELADRREALLGLPAMQPAATLGHAQPARSLVELAALHVWFDSGGFKTGKPDATQMKAIVAKARQMRDEIARQPASPGRDAFLRDTETWGGRHAQDHAAFAGVGNVPFDLDRLAGWAQRAQVEDPAFVAELDARIDAELTALKASAKNLPRAVDTPDREHVVDALGEVVKQLPSGARLRVQDGNRAGISTRGLSANFGKLLNATGIPLTARVDARYNRNRSALVEFARSNYGAEIFAGTADGSSWQAGAGVRVGYDFDVGLSYVRAGVTAQGVLYQSETNNPRGVSLRVTRRVKEDGSNFDDKTLEAKYTGLFKHLVGSAAAAPDKSAEGTWNHLADQYLEDEDISVGWTDGTDKTTRSGATFDVGVYGGIPHTPLSAGVGVGVGYTSTHHHIREQRDHGGSLQLEQHRSGGGSQWVGRLTAGLSGSVPIGTKPHTVGLGTTSVDTPSINLALRDNGIESRVQIARDNGVLMPRSCIVDVEYKSPQMFTRAIDAQRGAWRDLYALDSLKRQGVTIETASPEHWATAHARADEKIDRLLGEVRGNSAPNQTYFHRFRLRGDAATRINALTASEVGGQPNPAVAREINRIMSDPASWIASDLKVKEVNSSASRAGLNAALHVTAVTQVSGEHEIVSETADFAQLDALERYQADRAAAAGVEAEAEAAGADEDIAVVPAAAARVRDAGGPPGRPAIEGNDAGIDGRRPVTAHAPPPRPQPRPPRPDRAPLPPPTPTPGPLDAAGGARRANGLAALDRLREPAPAPQFGALGAALDDRGPTPTTIDAAREPAPARRFGSIGAALDGGRPAPATPDTARTPAPQRESLAATLDGRRPARPAQPASQPPRAPLGTPRFGSIDAMLDGRQLARDAQPGIASVLERGRTESTPASTVPGGGNPHARVPLGTAGTTAAPRTEHTEETPDTDDDENDIFYDAQESFDDTPPSA
ncbi:autotransporter [Burkholderia plantarii]|uniref:autotransporter n=1 Tax=Burkholderia plantarii TaxID=41899 RepID=UPI0018DC519F|nr:autotransporter [Burkholderia plantarii]MBI0330755.1 autotransporter [Burkholderia plantarii]